jgi:hypothetical protein
MMNVDFTASNGDPAHTTSLHYRNPYQPNAYQQAIAAVGTVLLEYDTDKLVAAYGFGGRIPPKNEVSHCFPLTFNLAQVEVPGVPGMLAAYANALSLVELCTGRPTLRHCCSRRRPSPERARASTSWC